MSSAILRSSGEAFCICGELDQISMTCWLASTQPRGASAGGGVGVGAVGAVGSVGAPATASFSGALGAAAGSGLGGDSCLPLHPTRRIEPTTTTMLTRFFTRRGLPRHALAAERQALCYGTSARNSYSSYRVSPWHPRREKLRSAEGEVGMGTRKSGSRWARASSGPTDDDLDSRRTSPFG